MKELESKLFIYDFEVFAHDWLVIFKDYDTKYRYIFHNDCNGVVEFLRSRDMILCGYNNKHYDQYILKGILSHYDPERIKEINEWIITEQQQGWQYKFEAVMNVPPQLDLMDDIVPRKSLKMLEGFMGMKIVESSIPFTIDTPLTEAQIKETTKYCGHDVNATEALYEERRQYVKTKLDICNDDDISIDKVGSTNAKLTALALGATPVDFGDQREYQYPPNLDLTKIPKEIIAFYDRLSDIDISDFDIFDNPETKKLEIELFGCPHVFGLGGIHGALPCHEDMTDGDEIILNYDFVSYYPHLMTKNGYLSRAITKEGSYDGKLQKRLDFKAKKMKKEQLPLKLVLNTTYGGMLDEYNNLFDPLMGRSVCITGQLYIVELLTLLNEGLKTFKIIQSNTDGIMFKIKVKDLEKVRKIVKAFTDKIHIPMPEETVERIAQKDVNNFVAIIDGKLKYKGGMTASYEPAFNMRNFEIVHKSLVDYFAYGIDPAETVNTCKEILAFQIIQKVGYTYDKVIQETMDGIIELPQRVNRIYASKDKFFGKIKKVKINGKAIKDKETKEITGYEDRYDSLQNCPPHAIIDNENKIELKNIDRSFYINLAIANINKFKGDKKKMEEQERDIMTIEISKLKAAEARERCIALEKQLYEAKQTQATVSPGPTLAEVVAPLEGMSLLEKIRVLRKKLTQFDFIKDGYNDQTKHEYITSYQFKEALNKCLIELGLEYSSGLESYENEVHTLQSGKPMFYTTITANPTIIDPDSGKAQSYKTFVQCSDTLDKAMMKCDTMLAGAFVKGNFLITDNADTKVDEPVKTEVVSGFVSPKKQAVVTEKLLEQPKKQASTAQETEALKLIADIKTICDDNNYLASIGKLEADIKDKKIDSVKLMGLIMKLEDKYEDLGGE